MKVANAIKKLSQYGEVKENGSFIFLKRDGDIISMTRNGGEYSDEIATIKVQGVNDPDDIMTDYSGGVFADNLSQAIRIAGWDKVKS